MHQSLQAKLSKIYWYALCIGVVAGCSTCTNPPVEQPDKTNKQSPLGPTPNRPKDPGPGELPSDPPAQPSPFQQAVQPLKDDPAKKAIYDFFKDVSGEQAIPKDAHQAWNKVLQNIGALGSLETATWLIEEGHLKVNEPDQKGELPLEKLLKNWIDKGASHTKTDENSKKLFTRLQAEGATIPKDKATALLKDAGKKMSKNLYTPLIETGADPNTEIGHNYAGQTILQWTTGYRGIDKDLDQSLLRSLLNNPATNVNARDDDNISVAHWAAYKADEVTFNILLTRDDLDINQEKNEFGSTVLDQVVKNVSRDAFRGDCYYTAWMPILKNLLDRKNITITDQNISKAQHVLDLLGHAVNNGTLYAQEALQLLKEKYQKQESQSRNSLKSSGRLAS